MGVLLLCGLILFSVLNVESSLFINGRNRQQQQQQEQKLNRKESFLESSLRNIASNKTSWIKDELIYIEQSVASSCNCVNYSCSCCAHLSVPKIKLNDTACVNLTYSPDDIGLKFTFDIDGTIYYEREISARNPPLMCFGIPYLEDGAKVCLKFYNLDWRNSTYTGCVDLVAYLLDAKVAQLKIGCFKFGNNSGLSYSRSKQYIYIRGGGGATNNKNNRTISNIFKEHENFIERIENITSTNELEESFSVFSRMDNLFRSLFRNSFYPKENRNSNYKKNKKKTNNNYNDNNDDWK